MALLDVSEKLLGVRASLGARPGGDVLLNIFPIFAVQFQGFKESEVLT